jgi:hypothetical protein
MGAQPAKLRSAMTEILFKITNTNAVAETFIGGINRGDIITYQNDGFAWSDGELHRRTWRIIRSALTRIETSFLAGAELNEFANKQYVWTRTRKLDLDNVALPQACKDWLADDSRAVPILDVEADLLRSFYIEKGDALAFVTV